jgi:hypothetical protein
MSNNSINNIYNMLKDNNYVSTFLIIFIGLYATLLGPTLPDYINNLFKKQWFKILYLFLFLLVLQYALVKKIKILNTFLIVVVFVLFLDYLYLNSINENKKK